MSTAPAASAVSPKKHSDAHAAPGEETAPPVRLDRYHGKPEVYVESNRVARLLGLFVTLVLVVGTGRWSSEALDRFAVPDSLRPAGFRAPQVVLAFAGIAAALVETAYLLYFTITGRVWRRWRGVAIVFGILAAASTALWLIDRFVLDRFFGPWT